MWIGLVVATVGLLGTTDSDDKIVGGELVKSISERPYMVEITWAGEHVCGGGIIQPKWILTACHCLGSFAEDTGQVHLPNSTMMLLYRVIAGSVFRSPLQTTSQIRQAQTFVVHPSCADLEGSEFSQIVYDVGALEVKKNFKFTEFIKPMDFFPIDPIKYEIQVASLRTNPKSKCSLSGWGAVSKDVKDISNQMKTLQVSFISDKDCLSAAEKDKSHYRNFSFPKWKQFCVQSVPSVREGPYAGDSGGPLVCNGFVIGVFITNGYNGHAFSPSVIQSVSVMMDLFEQRNILCDEPNGCRLLDSTTAKIKISSSEEPPSHSSRPSGNSFAFLTRTNGMYVLISVIVAVSL